MLHRVLTESGYRRHLEALRRKLAGAMGHTLRRLREHGLTPWIEPRGGVYVWARLPDGVAAADVARHGLARKVMFAPGPAFSASDTAARYLRFNASTRPWRRRSPPPEVAEAGRTGCAASELAKGRRLRLSNEAEMSFGNSDGPLLLAGIPGGADSSGPPRPVGSRPGCIRSARLRLSAAPASMDPVSGAKQGRKLPCDLLQFTYVTIFQIVFHLVENCLFSGGGRCDGRAGRPVIFAKTGQTGEYAKLRNSACCQKSRRTRPAIRRIGSAGGTWIPAAVSVQRKEAAARRRLFLNPEALTIPGCER